MGVNLDPVFSRVTGTYCRPLPFEGASDTASETASEPYQIRINGGESERCRGQALALLRLPGLRDSVQQHSIGTSSGPPSEGEWPVPAGLTSDKPCFQVCGGGHLDRHLWLQSAPVMGRTNAARQTVSTGGVAANIACHLARTGGEVNFVGVQPPQEAPLIAARLALSGVTAEILPLDGEVPGYSAVMTPDGELLVGAAAMSLYDDVESAMIMPHLDPTTALVIDANFPSRLLMALVRSGTADRPQFAAGTAVGKVTRLAPCLSDLHALVLNRAEAVCLAGRRDVAVDAPVDVLAQDLVSGLANGGVVLVSDGGAEAALANRQEVVVLSPPPLQVVNANGAGDAMAASLFWSLVTDPGMTLATRLHSALAAGADFAAGPPHPDQAEPL